MIFDSPAVQKYILSGAIAIATIRRAGHYELGQRVTMKVGDRILKGEVVAIAPAKPSYLREFVDFSGFKSVEEWIAEAERLHKSRIDPNKFQIIVVTIPHKWKLVMWISKEKLLPAQEKLLKGAGYTINIYNNGIYNVEDFLDRIKHLNNETYERVLLIPIVPESVKMRLLEEIRNRGLKFEVVEPVMKDLGRYDNEELCKMLLSQNQTVES